MVGPTRTPEDAVGGEQVAFVLWPASLIPGDLAYFGYAMVLRSLGPAVWDRVGPRGA